MSLVVNSTVYLKVYYLLLQETVFNPSVHKNSFQDKMGIGALFIILFSHPITHTNTHTHKHTHTYTQQTALLFDEHAFINQTTREAGTLKTNGCKLLHHDHSNKITGHDRTADNLTGFSPAFVNMFDEFF